MSSMLKSHISNSRSITERRYHDYSGQSSLLNYNTNTDDIQSSSVTTNGSLWQRRLAKLANESAFAMPLHTIEELQRNIAQEHKKWALIQLLRSWRAGDEQEQRSTLEYLQKAIDEDRTSYRERFP